MDDMVSVKVHWEPDVEGCLPLAQSLASIYTYAMGKRAEGEEPLLIAQEGRGLGLQQDVLRFDLETERMPTPLPVINIRELQQLLEEFPNGGRTATVREVLVLAGKLHHVAYVIRPGRYFVQRLFQLSKIHLNQHYKRRGGRHVGKKGGNYKGAD